MLKRLSTDHKIVSLWILSFLAACLPFSEFGISVSLFLLSINWLLEGDFRAKFKRIKHNKALLVFLAFIPVHLIWLLNSSNLDYGIHDLKIKLPFLVLPLIIGSSVPLIKKEINIILYVFISSVFVASLISFGAFLGFNDFNYLDIREISLFISHIRFSLMIVLSIFALGYLFYYSTSHIKPWIKILELFVIIWLLVFLFILKSITGIMVFLFTAMLLSVTLTWKIHNSRLRYSIIALISLGILYSVYYVSESISRFNYIKPVNIEQLDEFTLNANPYVHFTSNGELENGNRVWLYYCEKEISKEWNKRSSIDFSGKDRKGQDLKITLVRYLTSKGLKKDSIGIDCLLEEDIINIENGMANYIYSGKFAFYPVIYEILWQIRDYRNGTNPSGHSITQRLEYLKTGIEIVRDNFWFGVGTGDVPDAFAEQYINDVSSLDKEWRLRTHNQYLTFFISFGLTGFVLIIFILLYPAFRLGVWRFYYQAVFLCIMLLSMINEDTFETSSGAVFIAFFYSLFFFSKPELQKKNNGK